MKLHERKCHSLLGCSKCWKRFPRIEFGAKPDYSGFDLHSPTKTERVEKESKYGIRFSEFHRLPYFDPIKMHAVDPMHNLFLGAAKHIFTIWVGTNVLDASKLTIHDERQKLLNVPSTLGRVPNGVSKVYKTMKADEWKVG